jgi:hypothetical protein
MTPKITPEMREALAQQPGRPVEVQDDQTQRTYLLVDADRGRTLTEQWFREQLQVGLDAADRGDVIDFDPSQIVGTQATRCFSLMAQGQCRRGGPAYRSDPSQL